MTRPGFLVPNANLVAPDLQASQPDQGDFLVLGNNQYGVVVGCKSALSFPTVTLTTDILLSTAHILVCAGEPFLLQGASSVTLAGQGAMGRWDLVVFDSQHGGFKAITGTPADNPVFPDITNSMVVLAAVSVPAVGGGATPTIIDKRVFLQTSLVANADSAAIIRSYNTTTSTPSIRLNITGNGVISWGTATKLENPSPGVIKITDTLQTRVVTAADSATVGGFEVITEDTITWGPSLPVSADTGDLHVDTTVGDVSVWRGDRWSAVASDTPVGTVIMAFASASSMVGWLPLLGQTIPVTDAGGLPGVHPDWVTAGSITLPDMRGRLPVGGGYVASGLPGFVTGKNPMGEVIDDHGTSSVVMTLNNMPSHTHQTSPSVTTQAGGHSHTASTASAGNHTHIERGWGIWLPNVGEGGINVMVSANTNGTFTTGTPTDPAGTHSHLVTVNSDGAHTHTTPAQASVGGGAPLLVTPPTLPLYFYIKK